METSLLKTLADKYRSSVSKMARKYTTTIDTPHGPRKCFEASDRTQRQEATGRTVRRYSAETAEERGPHRPRPGPGIVRHKELVTRLLADRCEICAQHRTASRCTTSASSPISTGQDSRNPRGRNSWHDGDARPWWSAVPATTPSTLDSQRRTLT